MTAPQLHSSLRAACLALFAAACFGGGEEVSETKPVTGADAPSGEAATPAAAVDDGSIRVTMTHFGALTPTTSPRRVELMRALGTEWDVRDDGPTKGALQLIRAGSSVAEVFPDISGNTIEKIVTSHPDVVFPWETRVGGRIGAHKHWDRMGCEPGTGAFAGKAVCRAYEDRRFEYVLDLEGRGEIGSQDEASDLRVSAMIWRPKASAK